MGGAAGHMAHPFDLPWVEKGSDLLDFFDRAKTFVEKKGAGSVKIDGVNVSFKVVGDDDFKQFAVDRGSLKPIDIEGITMSRVDQRFPEGHGMRPALKSLLSILNAAIDDIKPELENLGMWDDPSRFLNTEYVEGTTNVTQYDTNFLAIHGLNQFYQRIGKVGAAKGRERPGMERPEGDKSSSVEVPYDPAVMEKLVEKLRPFAEKRGFQVYSSVPTEKSADIDYAGILSEPFAVRISDDRVITKSLGEWLSEATNPRYKTVQLKDGKRTHALHKQLYLDIVNGTTPIVDLIEDADAEAAIYGAVLMHTTRLLGNAVLGGLTSPMGDVKGHEGIVLRDEKLFGPNPVKITGEFIVGNLEGGFGQMNEEDEENEEETVDLEIVDSSAADISPEAAANDTIAIVPGSFKPPHMGHLKMVEEYANNNNKVVVLISNPVKNVRTMPDGSSISAAKSLQMWKAFASHLDNVEIMVSPGAASPMTAAFEMLSSPEPLNAGDVITLGASKKENDWKRWVGAPNVKGVRKDLEFRNPRDTAAETAIHSPEYMGLLETSPLKEEMPSVLNSKRDPREFHADDMRYLLGKVTEDAEAAELLKDFTGSPEMTMEFLSVLGIDSGMNEPLEEMIGMASGAIAGAAGNAQEDEEKDPLVTRSPSTRGKKNQKENIDMSLVNEVYELLIKRGTLA